MYFRPREPRKYPSKAAQGANLDMLIDWGGLKSIVIVLDQALAVAVEALHVSIKLITPTARLIVIPLVYC